MLLGGRKVVPCLSEIRVCFFVLLLLLFFFLFFKYIFIFSRSFFIRKFIVDSNLIFIVTLFFFILKSRQTVYVCVCVYIYMCVCARERDPPIKRDDCDHKIYVYVRFIYLFYIIKFI